MPFDLTTWEQANQEYERAQDSYRECESLLAEAMVRLDRARERVNRLFQDRMREAEERHSMTKGKETT